MRITRIGGVAGILAACAGVSATEVVLNSYGPGFTFDPHEALTVQGQGAGPGAMAGFMVEMPTGVRGTLWSIELALTHVGGSDAYIVSVHEDDSSEIGAQIWSWEVEVFPVAQRVPVVAGGVADLPIFEEHERFWVVVAPADAQSDARWHLSDQNRTGHVATRQWNASGGQWGPWQFSAEATLPAVRVQVLSHCYADCTHQCLPFMPCDEFICWLDNFAVAQSLPYAEQVVHYANCDGSTTVPVLTVDDFTCWIDSFARGCP